MIELTKDKLEEARFFLAKLGGEEAKQLQPPRPELSRHFLHYLRAFVSAHMGRRIPGRKTSPALHYNL